MKIVGIDLGEEKCYVAVFRGGRVQIVANDEGCRTTPAYVSFCENGRFIGASAKEEKSMNPENTIYNIRRILGRNFSDPVVQQEVNDVPFTITNENNKPMILVSYEGGMKKKKFLPEQISGMILKELKENAEVYLREPITDAVITVPAYFNDAQRAATRDAARIAELNVSSIICEATAAAIAYGLESEGKRNVLVFYLERSRLEVTVLTIDEDILTVKATICDTQLGGEVLINNLVQHCIREFKGKHEKNISSSKPAFNRLYVACESVLKKLSYFTRASIQIDGLVDGIDFRTTILRAKFEDLNADLLELTINTVEKVITDSNIVDDEIDDIVLVGEFTRVPKIREILMDQFPGKEIRRTINPNEVLAYGAASYGYRIASGRKAIREVFQDKNEFHTKADQQNNLTQDSTNIEIKEAIGIDLGTTLSGVSVYRNGKFEMVPNEMGNFLTPSCVAFTEIERLIGEVAKEEMALNSENTLVQIKRLIGRKFDDKSVKYDIKNLGFEIINEGNKPVIQVKHKKKLVTFHPEQISGMLLRNLKETADAFMGTNFTHAVITVPAYFDDAQRAATKNAGMIAGLNVLSVLNEPTAAAIAYGLEREDQRSRNVLIYDLGGGTFDVTVVTIKGRVFDVRATSGDSHLGGEDFDRRMVDHIVEEFNKKNKTDVRQDKRAICKLRTQCEIAKKRLSVCNEARVQVDALYNSIDFREKITRAKFEDLNLDYFMKTISTVENTLTEAKLTKDEIDDVVLVGGSSRIPKIRELLIAFFNGKKLCSTVNPDEVVARGAAAFAATFCQDTSVKIKDFVLEDILPFTLGVGCEGGVMAVVAKKGSKIPSQHYHVFTTNVKNPTALGFSIYQGEHSSTKYNRLLGSFSLTGIVPPTQGASQIDVCFDIDLSGILTATAKDRVTGKESNIRLDSDTGGLSSEKLKEMRCEEERFGIEDKSHKDILQLRNKLQDLVFSIEQTFQDLEVKGKIPTGEKLSMLEKCEEVLEWLEKTDNASKEEITEKHLQFEKMGHPYSSRSYQK